VGVTLGVGLGIGVLVGLGVTEGVSEGVRLGTSTNTGTSLASAWTVPTSATGRSVGHSRSPIENMKNATNALAATSAPHSSGRRQSRRNGSPQSGQTENF
jgi:hypothetical protein